MSPHEHFFLIDIRVETENITITWTHTPHFIISFLHSNLKILLDFNLEQLI